MRFKFFWNHCNCSLFCMVVLFRMFCRCYVGVPLVFRGVSLVFCCSPTVLGCSAIPPVSQVPLFHVLVFLVLLCALDQGCNYLLTGTSKILIKVLMSSKLTLNWKIKMKHISLKEFITLAWDCSYSMWRRFKVISNSHKINNWSSLY